MSRPEEVPEENAAGVGPCHHSDREAMRVAPSGWTVGHYKDLGTGGVVELDDPADEERSVVVALQHTPYRGFDADTLDYRGPVTTHTVQGRQAHLVEASMGWYLEALAGDAWFTVQAPTDMTAAQLLEIAEGVSPATPEP